jgi:Ca-activated chloride channel family protein
MPDPHHNANEVGAEASRAPRAIVAFLLVGATIAGAILALRAVSDAESCSDALILTVEAAPEVAAPIRSASAEYQQTDPSVDGTCVTIEVRTRAAHETAQLLGAGQDATAGSLPDVWIPDSTLWLDMARLQEPARALVPEAATTIATSPVVIAMPRSRATKMGWPGKNLSWEDLLTHQGSTTFWRDQGDERHGRFEVVLTNPQASSASLNAMISIVAAKMRKPVEDFTAQRFNDDQSVKEIVLGLERRSAAVPDSNEAMLADLRRADSEGHLPDYVSAVPMSENMVSAYNYGVVADGTAVAPKERLVAAYPRDGMVVQSVPFVPVGSGRDPARAAAAQAFLDALLGESCQEEFVEAGLRTPDRSNQKLTVLAGFVPDLPSETVGTMSPEAMASALELFRSIREGATTLAVIDTSGSMEKVVAGSGGRTRLDVAVAALQRGYTLAAENSSLGLWQFSRLLEGGDDYRELVPIGPLNEMVDGVSRRNALIARSGELKPAGDTGLYDTTLAAFRTLTATYTPGRPNQIVLLTDGKNEDVGSVSLDDLIANLRQEFNPERPVGLITIAYGNEADTQALQRISAVTGAKSYPALDENSISQVITNILTDR